MDKNDRSEKIKSLRRKENRKKLLPDFLNELNSISGKRFSENDVLSLEQIDENKIHLNSSDFSFNYLNLSFPATDLSDLKNVLLALEDEISRVNFFSLPKYSDYAQLNVSNDFVTSNLEQLIALDKDGFRVYDPQLENGLGIDLFQEYWFLNGKTEKIWIYELSVFGKKWMKKVAQNI